MAAPPGEKTIFASPDRPMCRFTLYLGPSIPVGSLVTEPSHSLIRQSYESREREEPLNGDGFGVAWYAPEMRETPGLFRSITPAWNNANLLSLAGVVRSHCILAHVRAATQVKSVSEVNCHPFCSGPFAFAHNGDLGAFRAIRRPLLALLSDRAFEVIQGNTDSEHLFALFLDRVSELPAPLSAEKLADALRRAFDQALELVERHGGGESSFLNVAVTNGRCAVVSRFTTLAGSEGESLHLDHGRRYVCERGKCRMLDPEDGQGAVLVSSEPLSRDPAWAIVPPNHLVLVDEDRSVRMQAV